MFRIRLLTFCTQHTAMRSAPSALPISISQPLQARRSCEAFNRSMSCAAGARSSTRYMPRLSSSFASSVVIRTSRRSVSWRACSLSNARMSSISSKSMSASDFGCAAPAAPHTSAAKSSITLMATARIGVMLVDDHAVVRMGFRLLLDAAPDMRVVAEADSGEEAMRRLDEARPEVVVMDISMPGIGGLEAVRRILAKEPGARILVLSAHEDAMHARRTLKAGAAGYLTKRSAAEALIQAIREVCQGKTFLEPQIAQELALRQVAGAAEPLDTLSEKEFKVFLALAGGQSVQDIAAVMSLSPSTVGTHLYNIKQKLGASNSAELALIAMRAGLLTP